MIIGSEVDVRLWGCVAQLRYWAFSDYSRDQQQCWPAKEAVPEEPGVECHPACDVPPRKKAGGD